MVVAMLDGGSVDLVAIRKKAESAVADMADGALKVKAFEVILGSLLASTHSPAVREGKEKKEKSEPALVAAGAAPGSISERIGLLSEEDFFSEPRSLAEIQNSLAEHGWHYPQTNLSTPLVRLVRQRRLRRLQLAEGNKKVWKYALP